MFSTPKFVTMYVFFKKIMGSTRSHPLPPGVFVQMPSPPLTRSQPIVASSVFDGWTDKDLDDEIVRLKKLLKEIERLRETPEVKIEGETPRR
jgi:hypothetical protein